MVDKYKLMRYIKLNHELMNAIWDSEAGKWRLTISTPQGNMQDSADFVINCTGPLSRWQWPQIEGLLDFKGHVVHSADWNLEKEGSKEAWDGKNVAVIGVVCTTHGYKSHTLLIMGIRVPVPYKLYRVFSLKQPS